MLKDYRTKLLGVEENEFFSFLQKFKGSLIFHGNSSRANKMFDNILWGLKKYFKKDPIIILYKVYLNLLPLFSVQYKRFGNKYQAIPKFFKGSNRNILVIGWLIKSLKGKSNVVGVKEDQIIKTIIDAYYMKGHAIINKKYYYDKVLSGRFFVNKDIDEEQDYYKSDYQYKQKISKKRNRRKRK